MLIPTATAIRILAARKVLMSKWKMTSRLGSLRRSRNSNSSSASLRRRPALDSKLRPSLEYLRPARNLPRKRKLRSRRPPPEKGTTSRLKRSNRTSRSLKWKTNLKNFPIPKLKLRKKLYPSRVRAATTRAAIVPTTRRATAKKTQSPKSPELPKARGANRARRPAEGRAPSCPPPFTPRRWKRAATATLPSDRAFRYRKTPSKRSWILKSNLQTQVPRTILVPKLLKVV